MNPFQLELHTVIVNDSVKRDALTKEQEASSTSTISFSDLTIWNTTSNQQRQTPELQWKLCEKPYQILFVDGNHKNFDLINEYPVEEWCGGKVQVIRRNREGVPKIIHFISIFCLDD